MRKVAFTHTTSGVKGLPLESEGVLEEFVGLKELRVNEVEEEVLEESDS